MIFGGISRAPPSPTRPPSLGHDPKHGQRGYSKPFGPPWFAAAGTIGIHRPSEHTAVVYGFVGNVSVKELFLSGFRAGCGLCHCP